MSHKSWCVISDLQATESHKTVMRTYTLSEDEIKL